MESARLGTADDVESVQLIVDRHRAEVVDERGASVFLRKEATSEPGLFERLNVRLGNEPAVFIVGSYDDQIFGYAFASIESLDDDQRVAVLTDFLVEAEIRKSGIGEAMMNLMLQVTEDRGCIGIDSFALPGDRNTKRRSVLVLSWSTLSTFCS